MGLVYEAKRHFEKLLEEASFVNPKLRNDELLVAYRQELITLYDGLNKVMFCTDSMDVESPLSIFELRNKRKDIEDTIRAKGFDNIEPNEIFGMISKYIDLSRQIEKKCHICEFLNWLFLYWC